MAEDVALAEPLSSQSCGLFHRLVPRGGGTAARVALLPRTWGHSVGDPQLANGD